MLQNWCMDYIALVGVNCFLRRKQKLRKLLLVSALASIGSLLIHIYITDAGFRSIILHFGLNSVMSILTFGWKDKRFFWENYFLLYLVVLFLGGVMQWEASLGIPASFFWIKAMVAAVMLSWLTIYLMQKREFMEKIFRVDVMNGGKIWELNAYWDSGNLLQDPYNGRPVNILQAKLAEQIFSEKGNYMRLVPYCSLGNTNGLLSVCDAEKMYIYLGEKRLEVKPAVFGIAEEGLLEGKEYDVILHASIMEKER